MIFNSKRTRNQPFEVEDAQAEGHSFIARNVHLVGDVYFSGSLRIDGRVDGRVAVHAGKKGMLVLSRGSVINGPVKAGNLICDGTIHGEVRVDERVECREHAVIHGNVYYGKIDITEGAQVEGRCLKHGTTDTGESENTGPGMVATRKPAPNFLSKSTAYSS